jgi:thiamine-phosphate pyrophosphorylase
LSLGGREFTLEATLSPVEKIHGFYAVMDRVDESLAAALVATATVVQIRLKGAQTDEVRAAFDILSPKARDKNVLVIINDDVDLAMALGADGVHLGQDDESLASARPRTELLIGISTHDTAQVARAVAGGADYLGFGPIYATATKHDPDPVVGVDGLRSAVAAAAGVPIVAIGGITPSRAAAVAAAGAAAACAISSINSAADPRAAATQLAAAFE